jgi:hypothetical protein
MHVKIKRLFILAIIIIPLHCVYAQSSAVKDAEKKKREKEEQEVEAYNKAQKEGLTHKVSIQPKEVQKRMKKSKRVTDKFYKKKLKQTWWQRMTEFVRKKSYDKQKYKAAKPNIKKSKRK